MSQGMQKGLKYFLTYSFFTLSIFVPDTENELMNYVGSTNHAWKITEDRSVCVCFVYVSPVCVCVCVHKIERERETETER
jgi:hypothetical protein